MPLAASAHHLPVTEILLTLVWCIGALAYGLPFSTNFRGCADRWADAHEGHKAYRRWPARSFIRFHSTIFAVVGTFALAALTARLLRYYL
jgi:hypothetical protein